MHVLLLLFLILGNITWASDEKASYDRVSYDWASYDWENDDWVSDDWACDDWASDEKASDEKASHDWASHDSPERDTFVLCASLVTRSPVWDIDGLGNMIVVEANQLKKYDPQGNLLFTQSVKNLGNITKLDARNPMKIMFFSEEQQLVGILDNSLTLQGEYFDLSTFGLRYAQAFSASFQNNKFWIYDQENSKLELVSTNKQQSINIENLKSLLEFNEVTQLIEDDVFLYLYDKTKGIYKLDNYGNLLHFIPNHTGTCIHIEKAIIYVLCGDKILAYSEKESVPLQLNLPSSAIIQFKKQGEFFYFLEKNKLSKFSFKK